MTLQKLSINSPVTLGNRYKCWYCGKEEPTTADHFYPKSLSGRLRVRSCTRCNILKADRTPPEWIMRIDMQLAHCKKNKGCHGFVSSFIRSSCEPDCPEKKKLLRMRNATLTLWNKIKWSVK